jgi:hypothetical protein
VHQTVGRQHRIATGIAITSAVAIPLLAFAYLLTLPMNHDVAWLLEATRRWVGGAELYRDIIEINPPLIFIENVLLTGGMLSKPAYLAGTCAVIAISAIWSRKPLVVAASLTLVGLHDFGQRDHLALIFLTPYLMVDDPKRRLPRILWAFLGAALKPHFLLIPLAFALAKRTREALTEFMLLTSFCGLFWLSVVLIWPAYLTDIIPLGNAVYSAFGIAPGAKEAILAFLALAIAALVAMHDKPLLPLATAAVGAVACFVVQGRYWPYHLVPAIGLSAIVVLLAASRSAGLMKLGLAFAGLGLLATNPIVGGYSYQPSVIPKGVTTILFLSDAVPTAYPMVTECGVFNASRYPTFWTLPGAWNGGKTAIFKSEIAKANADIRRYRPEIIFEDLYLNKLKTDFHFPDWLDLSDYRRVAGGAPRFQAWLRNDLDPIILDAPKC